jgi:hypothetical protein
VGFRFTTLDVNASLSESDKREKAWNALFLKH